MSTEINIDRYSSNPSGFLSKLYTQTSSSAPITATVAERSLLDGGVGSKIIPANGFQVGDSFSAIFIGHVSAANNETLRIRVKAGTLVLADTGAMVLAAAANKHWRLEMFFTVRAIGGASVASIATGGSFTYTKTANLAFEGIGFSDINNTTFDTTVSNELFVTGQWGSTNATNSIFTEIFTLHKTY